MTRRLHGKTSQYLQISGNIALMLPCTPVHGLLDPGFVIMVPEWRNLSQESQAPILVLRAACEAVWREILDQTYAEGMIAVEGDLMRHLIRGALLETTNWFKADGKLTPRVLEEKLYQAIVRQYAEFVA